MIDKESYKSLKVGSMFRIRTKESLSNDPKVVKYTDTNYTYSDKRLTCEYEIPLLGCLNQVSEIEGKAYHRIPIGKPSIYAGQKYMSDYIEQELIEEIVCL